jgi:hypothetical protein
VALGATLSAGMLLKYTTIGLLAPVGLVLGLAAWRRRAASPLPRAALRLGLVLVLPAAVFAGQKAAGRYANPADDPGGWLKPGEPAVMRPRDLLVVRATDRSLFAAPEYFRDQVYETGKYSYPALLYLSTFTDVSNFFQGPPQGSPLGWHERLQAPPDRARTPWSQRLQEWSMRLSLPLALAAVAGTLGSGILAMAGIVRGTSRLTPAAGLLTWFALGMHAPILIGLLRLSDPYTPGFWLPRLAMPSVTTFLVLGFVLADVWVARSGGRAARVVPRLGFAYATVCAAVYAGCLVA